MSRIPWMSQFVEISFVWTPLQLDMVFLLQILLPPLSGSNCGAAKEPTLPADQASHQAPD